MQNRFAVIGNPVSHSLSPWLFRQYVQGLEGEFAYTRILAENIAEAMPVIRAFDLKGINVTAPFKEKILSIIDIPSAEVIELQAANTVLFKDKIYAFNTDVDGVLYALRQYLPVIKSALVTGAGGAAKAAVMALQKANAGEIFVYNRTLSKSLELSEWHGVNLLTDEKIPPLAFDMIINTTPVVLPMLRKIKLAKQGVILDADYKNKPLKDFAAGIHWHYVDGLYWLAGQGAEAYRLMTGIENQSKLTIPGESVINHIRDKAKVIVLTGMMGSGKSKIAPLLADRLGFEFVDMDAVIEAREKKSIEEIFVLYGEKYFRSVEKELLSGLLNRKNMVIAGGGGIVVDPENREMMKEKAWNILLYCSPQTGAKRIAKGNRPLLKNQNALERLKDIFNKRKKMYFSVADVIINRDDIYPDKQMNIEKSVNLIYEDYSNTFFV